MPQQRQVVDLTLDDEEVVNGTDLSDHSLLEAVNAIDLTLDDDDESLGSKSYRFELKLIYPLSLTIVLDTFTQSLYQNNFHLDSLINLHDVSKDRLSPDRKYTQLDSTMHSGQRIHLGDTVELGLELLGTERVREGDFLHIHHILRNRHNGNITLLGLRLRRTSERTAGLLPNWKTELFLDCKVYADDPRPVKQQNLEATPLNGIITKRIVHFTKAAFPAFSFRDRLGALDRRDNVEYFPKRGSKPCQLVIAHFTAEEATADYRIPNKLLREVHHGDAVPKKHGMFTLADMFCGAGGVTCGATQAGLHPKWAVDFNEDAVKTYQLNNPRTRVYCEEINYTITQRLQDDVANSNKYRVHVLHASPSCKTIARCYTVIGRNHDANQATMTVMKELLKKIRPIYCTLEESDNIRNHGDWCRSIMTDFLSEKYSIAYKIVNAADHELSSWRKRFILVAACPGAPLPPFPAATHGPGLLPYNYVAQALISLLEHPEATHNHPTKNATPRDLPSYDPYTVHAKCQTTKGAGGGGTRETVGSYHPSGTRDFTTRESATLQGLPTDFNLGPEGLSNKGKLQEQIGNMVPPPLAKAVFVEVRKKLEEMEREDQMTAA